MFESYKVNKGFKVRIEKPTSSLPRTTLATAVKVDENSLQLVWTSYLRMFHVLYIVISLLDKDGDVHSYLTGEVKVGDYKEDVNPVFTAVERVIKTAHPFISTDLIEVIGFMVNSLTNEVTLVVKVQTESALKPTTNVYDSIVVEEVEKLCGF